MSECFVRELKIGQRHFSNQEIETMSKSELVEHVVTVRKIAGTSSAVKQFVSNFVPSSTGLGGDIVHGIPVLTQFLLVLT